jgi:hypothetical protein
MKTVKNAPSASTVTEDSTRIVVLTQGFVFVGDWHHAEGGRPAFIDNAYNVRSYGTTAGIGELALTGPTKDTALDPCGVVVPDPGALVYTIVCNPAVWGAK